MSGKVYCGLPGAQVCGNCDTTDWSCVEPAECGWVKARPPWERRRYKCSSCGTEFGSRDSRFWQWCSCGRRTAPMEPWRGWKK